MALLKRAIHIGRRRLHLTDAIPVAYRSCLQTRLDDLLKITPPTQAGLKLQRIIKRFRQNLLVFVTHRDLSPTNNGAEQALRPYVVFRKMTNCFRPTWGACLYATGRPSSKPPSARRARSHDPAPSVRPARALQAKTSSGSLACPSLHPLKSWSLRQTRGGSCHGAILPEGCPAVGAPLDWEDE